jgi:hypothetical protein
MRMKDKCRRNYPRGRSRASKGVNPQSLYQQGYYSCSMVTLAKLMGDPKSVKWRPRRILHIHVFVYIWNAEIWSVKNKYPLISFVLRLSLHCIPGCVIRLNYLQKPKVLFWFNLTIVLYMQYHSFLKKNWMHIVYFYLYSFFIWFLFSKVLI